MEAIFGFLAGYLFATKFGLINFSETKQAWNRIKKSQETQAIFGAALQIIRHLLTQYIANRR